MANKRKLIMANRKILSLISKIRKSYPNIKSISGEFEAKGEKFSDFYRHLVFVALPLVSLSKDEINDIRYGADLLDLFVEIMFVDNRAGFSNEDSRGSILIDFKEGFIKVNVEVASWTDLGESKIDLKRQKNLKKQNKY
jgi:hypothetical protein